MEQEYKELKIKTAIHMYGSDDPAVKAAVLADQGRRNRGRKSIMKDAEKYAEELGVDISSWTSCLLESCKFISVY